VNPFSIRPAHPDEAAALTELVIASKRHWGYSQELISLWEEDLTITPEFIGLHRVHVAEVEGRAAGVFAVAFDGVSAELEHLWVDPKHIGTGLGKALLTRAIEVARDGGARTMVVVSDPNAEEFYLRLGARRIGRVDSVPEGRTLPKLELDLRAAHSETR
jgi:GNAT superfamily N-acetyltransferase